MKCYRGNNLKERNFFLKKIRFLPKSVSIQHPSLFGPWAGFIKSSQHPHLASLHGVALSQPLKFKPFDRVSPSGQQPYLEEKVVSS